MDTNVCIALMNGKSRLVRKMFRSALVEDPIIGVSSIVLFELHYGVAKSSYPETGETRLMILFEQGIVPVQFSEQDAATAGLIRATLERNKMPIGPFDTLIAGQALSRGLTLVTANVREFDRVEGLLWVDWSAAT